MLTSAFQREHCVSHRRFWLLLLQVHRRGLHNCHWGSLIKEISTSASFSFYELQSVKMIPWRWSVWWPSMEPGGLASGTSGRGLRTSRTIFTQFFSHVPNIFFTATSPFATGALPWLKPTSPPSSSSSHSASTFPLCAWQAPDMLNLVVQS